MLGALKSMAQSYGYTKVLERQKLNVFEIKCLMSMIGVFQLDRVRNEVLYIRVRIGVD